MIKIISLHILKTGGMSFLEILKDQYGKDSVYRYTERYTRLRHIRRKIVLNTFPRKTKVLHGHLVYRNVEHLVRKHQSKVIVWFRNPVERVISRYYFLMKNIEKNPRHSRRELKILSLLEYANRPGQMNEQSRFVDGIDLDQLFFFGFLETFNDDLQVLAEKLQWQSLNSYHNNSNVNYKSRFMDEVSDETRNEIRALNTLDVELYNHAWKMKHGNVTPSGSNVLCP